MSVEKEKIKKTARMYALQNAIQFNGKANEKAVIGKVIAAFKKEEISPKEIIPISGAAVREINSIPLEKQVLELEQIAPELLHKEKKERDFSLPKLPHAEKGKVVTRFPPEPNGYLHIGHAKAAIVDYEYAQMYDGKFILRFDDTNPENAEIEFYEAQKEDLRWLGIEWDKEYHTSDNLKTHYKLAEQLINQGDAYICKCTPEAIKEGRFHSKACSCRKRSSGETFDLWKELLSSEESKGAILRLRGEMKSANTAMRDPTLFRVIDKEHPLQGDKYRVWPTYDFTGAVEDSISGVTHPFRTKEYELRDPVYFRILSLLNLRKPHLMEFSRLSIEGMPVSKRKIKPLIEKGLVLGYDDIRLPTLRGLKKRGIVPEAIRQFVFSQGISKAESTVDFSIVEAINRKILDPKAKRYFFVSNPVKLSVDDAPKRKIRLKLHPTVDMGERMIATDSVFFVQKEDMQSMTTGDIFRLKGLYNVKIQETGDAISGRYEGEKLIADTAKIQWTTKDFIKMKIYVPRLIFKKDTYNPKSLVELQGYAEKAVSDLKSGEIIQFERVGFVRIEKQEEEIIGFFAHK
jgi:glutamyl-tRNA synthetase